MIPRDHVLRLEHRRRRLLTQFLLLLGALIFTTLLGFGSRESHQDSGSTIPKLLFPLHQSPTVTPVLYFDIYSDHEFGVYAPEPIYAVRTVRRPVALFAFRLGHESNGLIAPWLSTHSFAIYPETQPTHPITNTDRLEIRHAIIEHFKHQPQHQHLMRRSSGWLKSAATADGKHRTIIPGYFLIDIIFIISLPLAIYKGNILLRERANFIRARRLYRKQCPRCFYDLAGIEHQATNCPECGQTLKLKP